MEDGHVPEPHKNDPDEDPALCLGEWIGDPWCDPMQGDWPTETVDIATGRVSS